LSRIAAQTRHGLAQFDKLSSGDWNPDTVVNGNIKFAAGSATRIWNTTYAFPKLKLRHGGTHALGNYPAGDTISITFTDGAHRNAGGTFGWIVNGALADAQWVCGCYRGGRQIGYVSDRFRGEWKGVTCGDNAVDEFRVTATEGIPTGLLLIEFAAYDSEPAGLLERVDL
jgi:hypothetical protein